MDVYIKNIQGFQGDFTYSIKPGLNVITSMYNGTGKTTFFECLKFLHNPDGFDKTNRRYLLNKNENQGIFIITIDDNHFGFILTEDKYELISKLKGEQVFTNSLTPHPNIGEYTEVFFKNNSFINVCDRFLNLFSSSNTNHNHELVNAFLTCDTFEQADDLIMQEVMKLQTINDNNEKNLIYYTEMLKTIPNFQHLNEFENALDATELIEFYDSLENIHLCLEKCNVMCDEISEEFMVDLYGIYILVNALKQQFRGVDSCYIEDIYELYTVLITMQDIYPDVLIKELEDIYVVAGVIDGIDKENPIIDYDDLCDFNLLSKLLVELHINLKKMEKYQKYKEEELSKIKTFEYKCPVMGTVYIVGGECLSKESVI